MGNDPAYAYRQGSYYENFMCRAYQSWDTSKPGLHGSAMQNLIDAENGKTLVDWLGSFEKQLTNVKGYMIKALEKYSKMKLQPSAIQIIEEMKLKVIRSKSTSELMEVIETVMDLTSGYKI